MAKIDLKTVGTIVRSIVWNSRIEDPWEVMTRKGIYQLQASKQVCVQADL